MEVVSWSKPEPRQITTLPVGENTVATNHPHIPALACDDDGGEISQAILPSREAKSISCRWLPPCPMIEKVMEVMSWPKPEHRQITTWSARRAHPSLPVGEDTVATNHPHIPALAHVMVMVVYQVRRSCPLETHKVSPADDHRLAQ
jgi:hypothetical protein